MENIFSDQVRTKRILLDVKHKRIEEKDFTDDTTAVVTGAVLFPKSFTEQSSDCGLPKAEILVFEPDKDPDTYETDDGGWFELALPRGKTFTIRARYNKHTICYAGATVEDARYRNSTVAKVAMIIIPYKNLEMERRSFSAILPSQKLTWVYSRVNATRCTLGPNSGLLP